MLKYLAAAVLLVLPFLSVREACAQDQILVMGKVISTVDDEPLSGVRIFVFKTVGAGHAEFQRALTCYEEFYQPDGAFVDYLTMPDGTFEFNAQPNGSLIFYQFPFKPVFVKIRGMNKIPTVKIEATTVLDASNLVEEGKKKTRKGTPVALGNKFAMTEYYYFDQSRMGAVDGIGKENARLVAQMYLVNSDGTDTLQYFTPRVYDGEQFHKTQYHWRKDYLYEIADKSPRLRTHLDSLQLPVSFEVEDPTALYFCKADIWIEDYLKVYYRDSIDVFNTGRVSRPFQFLEYSFEQCQLDPQKYYKPPRREDVSAQKNMRLQFVVGQAELDRSDAATMAALDSLKTELRAICEDPASRLNELHFEGLSSPDGKYAKNKPLSDKRTQTVFNEVWKVVPPSWRDKVFKTVKGRVASWGDVADLMEAKSFVEEAAAVRRIVASTSDMDSQGEQIRRLPFYRDKVKPVLPELRSVKCNHVSQVYRFLTPAEILEKYNTDESYRNGTKVLTLNEYWNLFNLVKDEGELENLYNRAFIAALKTEGRKNPWALPANHLAVMRLRRKQVDTMILKPFIDERQRANFSIMIDEAGNRKTLNDDAIVANQVQMFMLAKNYARAEELSSIIENEHPMLRAVVRCLGGFIDYTDPKEEATIDLIKRSSVRNQIVINMYQRNFDSTAVKLYEKLPQGEPLTDYLKAQRLCVQYDGDIIKMKATDFDRSEDSFFSHPKDEIIEAATPEEIAQKKEEIERIKGDIEIDMLTFGAATEFSQKQLEEATAALEKMEKGETSLIPAACTVYEAASIYLKSCFEKDSKYIKTAQADYDITEDLLNDVLGLEKGKRQ